MYVGERGSKFAALTAEHAAIDEVYTVSAGKFRRYHGESWLRRLIDIKTIAMNLRDGFKVFAGIFQAYQLLGKVKPDVVFLKGGFVGVPIGLAAAMRRIPTVTHDSDALVGLANRFAGRKAKLHATALSAQYYPYPAEKVRPVGVLVEHSYQPVDDVTKKAFKEQLGLSGDTPVLLITGGSTGAHRVNLAVVSIIDELLKNQSELHVIHQVGQGKTGVYNGYTNPRLQILEFLNPMYQYMGAADLVVCRSSGNTVAELGVQGKACIAIPNPDLTGGHQLKNAAVLKEQGAARIILEEQLYDIQQGLLPAINELLNNDDLRSQLGKKLQEITIPDAAHRLAVLLLEQAKL